MSYRKYDREILLRFLRTVCPTERREVSRATAGTSSRCLDQKRVRSLRSNLRQSELPLVSSMLTMEFVLWSYIIHI